MSQTNFPLGPGADVRWHISMTPREAVDFLQKLATDDAFRSALETNPQQVLAQYHTFLSHGQFPTPVTLPSKQDLQDALNTFTTEAVPGIPSRQTIVIPIKPASGGTELLPVYSFFIQLFLSQIVQEKIE